MDLVALVDELCTAEVARLSEHLLNSGVYDVWGRRGEYEEGSLDLQSVRLASERLARALIVNFIHCNYLQCDTEFVLEGAIHLHYLRVVETT